MAGKVVPFGYTGNNGLSRLDALMADDNRLIVDIRYSPHSRWHKQWEGRELEQRYFESFPLARYVWLQALGNVNYRNGEPIHIADAQGGIEALKNLLTLAERDIILLCACSEYETCHRRVVVELLKQVMPEIEVL